MHLVVIAYLKDLKFKRYSNSRTDLVSPEIGVSKHLIQVIVGIVREKKLIAACSDDVLGHGQTVFVGCREVKTDRGKDCMCLSFCYLILSSCLS